MEAITILIDFSAYMEFTMYQMDVKSAFLNGYLKEEVFVKQHPGFESEESPYYVFKLDKAMYGLKQAPRSWYKRLSKFLLTNNFTLPLPLQQSWTLIKKGNVWEQKLYRGIIGSLFYHTESRPDIVFSVGLCARFQPNPKESHLKTVKRILRYLKGTPDLCLWCLKEYSFDLVGYVDADYAGFHIDRKSTSGISHFLGSCLVSWGTKKQNSMALSTAEAEYVIAASCCAQLLWIRQQLRDYGIFVDCVPIFCDNTGAINIAKNP
ncbi:secreted RxLR effector protein 161-like [Nicotiana tabacum]|uniref:Secreted RxLR effector protein 161-like n=1 Tax=Nicotiana tabacum TaxID=4097 RepID=A0AC58T2U2_TOBAC